MDSIKKIIFSSFTLPSCLEELCLPLAPTAFFLLSAIVIIPVDTEFLPETMHS